mmetsp:Transcript_5433/g.9159  ORF Transcript_5433/g.9159 Transcript_5433/m.9159 type:complete len:245 (+) Transcript_5433:55-789(+)
MEVLDLSYELSNLRYRGVTLNLDEKMQLEMALHQLHTDQAKEADELLFWGKITGIKNDYFVAMSVTYQGQFEFPFKRFYWCLSNDFSFKEMPDLNDQHKDFINNDTSYFVGEPSKKLIQPAEGEEAGEDPKEDEGEEGEEGGKKELDSDVSEQEEVKVPHKDLVEIDRLKYVVLAIENDCQIAPVGAFKMTSQHQVRRNEAFKGLDAKSSCDLRNYAHFRNVQSDEKKKRLDEPSAPFGRNFLE